MHVTAIIAAGGRGERLGAAQPKQLLAIRGRTILERSIDAFVSHPEIAEVVVALPAELAADPPACLIGVSKPLRIVPGGRRRQDSVMNAFRAASEQSEIIVIHDAARPFASADLISRTIRAAVESGAAIAAVQSRDTVKRMSPAKAGLHEGAALHRIVGETLPRHTIFLAQTPQAFRRDVLESALAAGEHPGADATDEAALAERAGHEVRLVEGEATNIKITTPDDLVLAQAISSPPPVRTGRAGIGYDLHRLVEGRPLLLGGVPIPFERGLVGHSDADAVCHAITDAIFGAAAESDIGRHFPDTDERWKGASSLALLRQAAAMLRDRGFEVGNVDASIVAERPKLAPYVDRMRENIAGALGISIDRVSLKGKTNEGVGALGRGEAIAVHAIALIRQL